MLFFSLGATKSEIWEQAHSLSSPTIFFKKYSSIKTKVVCS
jgi:hypothetical protein